MTAAPQETGSRGSAPLFAALGDETRLRLVARLSSGGPQSIAGLTTGTPLTRQAITKHLHVLAHAGLVRGIRQGRESRWELAPQPLEEARRFLEFISRQWTERLEGLERHLEAMPDVEDRVKRAPSPRRGRTRSGKAR